MRYIHCTLFLLVMLIGNAILIEENTEEFQKGFAKTYNDVRSRYARGEVEGFPSVTNMMEASWSNESAKIAEDVLSQLCLKGNYSLPTNVDHHILVTIGNKNDSSEYWSDAFYRDPTRNNDKNIQQTIRPEVTGVGCAVSLCRDKSYAVCAHGKIKCSGNCIKYDKGPVCSKCPAGSKCTLDGLCSLREDASNTVTRMPIEYQHGFVRYLNIERTRLAVGLVGFQFNEKGEQEGIAFLSASKMMEVMWSDSAASKAESAAADYCRNGTANHAPKGKYQLGAYQFYANYYNMWTPKNIYPIFFELSNVAFPFNLTSEYLKSEEYTDFFSWPRLQILTSLEEITEVGCSMEYCRGDAVIICAFGKITCTSNCSLYQKGQACTKCPAGTKCTFDKLCSTRKEATNKLTRLSKNSKAMIIDTINESRSKIAKGEHQILRDLDGQRVNRTMTSVTNMREVEWNVPYSVTYAEMRLLEWCQFAQSEHMDDLPDKLAAWSFPVNMENSSRNSSVWDIPKNYFIPSHVEWPQNINSEDQFTQKLGNIFRWDRFDMLMSWASASYIGCAQEYCRGEIILMCHMGEFQCFKKCRLYQNGTTCSNCPENTFCATNGLCRLQKNATSSKSTTMTPLLDDEKEQIVAESIKKSCRRSIAIEYIGLIFGIYCCLWVFLWKY